MEIDEHRARMILEATHAAWSRGDVEGLLKYFVDDVTYCCNTGAARWRTARGHRQECVSADAAADRRRRRKRVGARILPVRRRSRSRRIECYIRHRTTRHVLVGSYRQLVTYRGDRIERLEEFHDAAKMIAFWQMISGETEIERTLLAQPLVR